MEFGGIQIAMAFGWGLLAASGIAVGVVLALWLDLSHRTVAATMSVGAGILLAAASFELADEAVAAIGALPAMMSLAAGALVFSVANAMLVMARNRKRCGACVTQPSENEAPGSGISILLGTLLDAVPEAIVLGTMLQGEAPDVALVAAFALSNLPEALSSSEGMQEAGRSRRYILGVWGSVVVGTGAATALSFALLGGLGPGAVAALQALGAGALIAMAAETLIPEAFHNSPRYSGVLAAGGFAVLLLVASLGH